jgi:hypothetical protein
VTPPSTQEEKHYICLRAVFVKADMIDCCQEITILSPLMFSDVQPFESRTRLARVWPSVRPSVPFLVPFLVSSPLDRGSKKEKRSKQSSIDKGGGRRRRRRKGTRLLAAARPLLGA